MFDWLDCRFMLPVCRCAALQRMSVNSQALDGLKPSKLALEDAGLPTDEHDLRRSLGPVAGV